MCAENCLPKVNVRIFGAPDPANISRAKASTKYPLLPAPQQPVAAAVPASVCARRSPPTLGLGVLGDKVPFPLCLACLPVSSQVFILPFVPPLSRAHTSFFPLSYFWCLSILRCWLVALCLSILRQPVLFADISQHSSDTLLHSRTRTLPPPHRSDRLTAIQT